MSASELQNGHAIIQPQTCVMHTRRIQPLYLAKNAAARRSAYQALLYQ